MRAFPRNAFAGTAAPIHVAFAASASYFRHTAVSAISLLEHGRGAPVALHLVTCDDDAAELARLVDALAPYPQATLECHRVPAGRIAGLHEREGITRETYLRILIPQILPRSIRRVLYLDSDVVVADDVAALWATNLGGKAVAGARDLLALVGNERNPDYINAGVLVMDLDRWRIDGLAEHILDYAFLQGERLEFQDQDAINAVLAGDIAHLDPRWNVQTHMYRCGRPMLGDAYAPVLRARRDPGIIHYITHKPWTFRSRTLRRRDYFRHQARTPWRGMIPSLDPVEALEYRIDRALVLAGIDRAWIDFQRERVAHRLGRMFPAFVGPA